MTETLTKERGAGLTAALTGHAAASESRGGGRLVSLGGPPIWVMAEAFMPTISEKREREGGRFLPHDGQRMKLSDRQKRKCTCPEATCKKHGFDRQRRGHDADGFEVFGRYPKGWLTHVLKMRLLGSARRDEILHVCSGTLGPVEKFTIDLRRNARPLVVGNGCALPFRAGAFKAVMLDPPYSEEYSRNLYGTAYPRPSWLLREAARVVVPGGRFGILHIVVPFAPRGCRLLKAYGVTTGVGFRIRAFTVYEKHQRGLPL